MCVCSSAKCYLDVWLVQRCVYREGCLLLNAFVHILCTGSQLVECLENQMLIWEVFCVLDGDWLSVWHAKCWFDGCFVHWKPIGCWFKKYFLYWIPIGCWFEGCFVHWMLIGWMFGLLNADLRNVLSTECQMVADLRFSFLLWIPVIADLGSIFSLAVRLVADFRDFLCWVECLAY